MSSSPTETRRSRSDAADGRLRRRGDDRRVAQGRGDEVAADETICEVTTDKIDVEIPARQRACSRGSWSSPARRSPVGTLIAEIAPAASAAAPALANERSSRRATSTRATRRRRDRPLRRSSRPWSGGSPTSTASTWRRSRDTASAGGSARRTCSRTSRARRRPTDEAAGRCTPSPRTGPSRRPQTAPQGTAGSRRPRRPREPMAPMRKAIAGHMVDSRRTAAHCTTMVEVDFSAVAARRAELKPRRRRARRAAHLPRVRRAGGRRGAGGVPVAQRLGRGRGDRLHEDVNLGIAVALDAGLVVPVIRRAQRLTLEGLAAAIADVARRARASASCAPTTSTAARSRSPTPASSGRCSRRRSSTSRRWRSSTSRRSSSARSWSRPRRRRVDRDPADGVPVHVLGPPGARRRRGGALPRRGRQRLEAGAVAMKRDRGSRSQRGPAGFEHEESSSRGRAQRRRRWRSPSTRPRSARRWAARGCGTTARRRRASPTRCGWPRR